MSEERIIFPESDEAAVSRSVVGWVSSEGRFYGSDEQAARWGGATHIHCSKCGAPTPKNWTVCEACRKKQAHEKYIKLPLIKWNESVPVYSLVTGEYYYNKDDVQDEDPDGIFDPVPLQLVLCKPIYAPGIDPESYYEDLLPEYDELSDVSQVLVDAFQELNDILTDTPVILSYEPTDTAVI